MSTEYCRGLRLGLVDKVLMAHPPSDLARKRSWDDDSHTIMAHISSDSPSNNGGWGHLGSVSLTASG